MYKLAKEKQQISVKPQQQGMFQKSVIIIHLARERRSEISCKNKKVNRSENTEKLANTNFSSIHSDLTHVEVAKCPLFPLFPRFREGLKTLGLMEAVIQHPEAFRSTFCFEPKKLCSTDMTKLFKICRSERGSNRFNRETEIVSFWYDFLGDVEGNQQ